MRECLWPAIVWISWMSWLGCVSQPAQRAPTAPSAPPPVQSEPVLTATERSIDPCLNFADFACGTATAQPGLLQKSSAIRVMDRPEAIRQFLERLVSGAYTDGTRTTAVLREVYARCTDPKARDLGLSQIGTRLDEISRIRTLPELARHLGAQRLRGVRSLITVDSFYRTMAPEDPVVARVAPAPPELGRRVHAANDPVLAQYRTHLEKLAALVGQISAADISGALRVDRVLASWDEPTPSDRPKGLSPVVSGARLEKRRFPWLPFVSGLGLSPNAPILPADAEAMARIDALAAIPIADLKGHLKVRMLETAAPSLGVPVFEEEIRFHRELIDGSEHQPFDLRYACADLMSQKLNPWLEEAFLRSVPMPAQGPMRELFTLLRERFAQTVASAAWLDETTRRAASEKIRGISLRSLGDPIPGFDDLTLQPGSLLDARSAIAKQSFAVNVLSMVGAPMRRSFRARTAPPGHSPGRTPGAWAPMRRAFYPDYVRAAQYGPETNGVWISPELARTPWIHARPFDAVVFGSLGTTMGHEIAHGLTFSFGPVGAAAKKRETWPKETAAAFDARAACLEGELRGLDVGAKWTVDARRTLDEDLADLLGIRLALATMEFEAGPSSQQQRDERRRTFFIAFAQQRCGMNGNFADEETVEEGHSPLGRVLGSTLANVPEFAETFHCAPGTPMAPRKSCWDW